MLGAFPCSVVVTDVITNKCRAARRDTEPLTLSFLFFFFGRSNLFFRPVCFPFWISSPVYPTNYTNTANTQDDHDATTTINGRDCLFAVGHVERGAGGRRRKRPNTFICSSCVLYDESINDARLELSLERDTLTLVLRTCG